MTISEPRRLARWTLRYAFYASLGATILALYWQIAWVRDTCGGNPHHPDPIHSHYLASYGRSGGVDCYVSAGDMRTYYLILATFSVAVLVTLGLGLLGQRYRSAARAA